ncbi:MULTISPECIES: hypothetical protein [unclassified Pseudomonas]|uniref:hypothetical protein n=1 Tax=unclassified Pseudomonas TaxID=196821 RepID=UPI001EF01E6F|nr:MULTISPECIES: hypothetical protein [unclassified Pseudomonas]
MKKQMIKACCRVAVALLWLVTLCAAAATQEITAVFKPDPSNPLLNKFVNTTPQSGVCPGHMPARCEALGIFSIRTWDINFTSNTPLVLNHVGPGPVDVRKGVMFKVPSEWRSLEVVSDKGERETVQVRIAGIGNRFDVTRPGTIHSWSPRTFVYAPAPCLTTGMGTGTSQYLLWFWVVPEGAGTCSLTHVVEVPELRYVNFEYAYELRTPNPLGMSTGHYTGSITYTVGPHQDFDFGDIMIPNDSLLTFNFNLDVQHTLKVEVPPGGNRVELVPQGGWQAWLQRNRRPERLFRDQTFNISVSSRFKMQLDCQYGDGGNECLVREPESGGAVPLNISVTLPSGLTDAAGQPVSRRPLLRDGSGTELFQPGHYVDRKPGVLHFEIAREKVEEMLTGVGKTYSGNVTVIWSSEI